MLCAQKSGKALNQRRGFDLVTFDVVTGYVLIHYFLGIKLEKISRSSNQRFMVTVYGGKKLPIIQTWRCGLSEPHWM
jgi:hypothetical protein